MKMLPEHVKMLKQLIKEEDYVAKPELDEQQLELLQDKIDEAMEFASVITVSYHEDHANKSIVGRICRLDIERRHLYMMDKAEKITRISLEDILDIEALDV